MHHEAVFHHPNHSMGEPSMNHGQPVYGTGMEQYETVSQQQQQQGAFHEMLPHQQHYHPLPPMMVSMQYIAYLTFDNVSGDTDFQHQRITMILP
jgi:hypothetical protein